MASATQQVSDAVTALHGQSAEQREAANRWLLEFLNSDAAWEAGVALLDAAHGGQLQFFGANMVLVKVRSAWAQLGTEAQGQLTTAVSAKFQALLAAPATEAVVVQRTCLALGAIAARSGPDAARGFTSSAVRLSRDACGSGDAESLRAGIDLLTAVAEEVKTQLGRRQRSAVCATLVEQSGDVLQTLGAALSQSLNPAGFNTAGGNRAGLAAVKCFQAWLGLDASDGNSALMSPGELYSSQRQLFTALLAAAGSGSTALLDELADTLGMFFGSGKFGSDAAAEEAALRVGAQGLLRHQSALGSVNGEAIARTLATAATAMAERSPDAFAGGLEEAVPLADMIMDCLARPEQSVADAALEYITCLDYVAMANRAPPLRAPMYGKLLPRLLQHAAFPEDFTTWEECITVDEEVFDRFREQILADGFETGYNVLRAQFVMFCGKAFAEARTWQAAEAALLAVRVAAEDAVPRALEAEPDTAEVQRDARATSQCFAELFSALTGGDASAPGSRFRGNAMVAAATARLIGACADWFAGMPGAPLEGALNLLLQTLAAPEAAHAAASAFRSLCVKCHTQLQSSATVTSLAAAVDGVITTAAQGTHSMQVADRQALAEGLAKLAAGLPAADASAAGTAIIAPCLQRLQQLVNSAGNEPTAGAIQGVADEVAILSTVFRHLEFAAAAADCSQPHPATQLLQDAYPSLDALLKLQAWRSHEAVVAAVCSVFRYVIQSVKHGVAGLLPTLIASLDATFQSTRYPASLQALAAVSEVAAGSQEAQAAVQTAFASSSTIVASIFRENAVSAQQDVVAAYFKLADALLRHSPAALLTSEQLLVLLSWVGIALRAREVPPTSAAVELLSHLGSPDKAGISTLPGFQANQARLQQCFALRGDALVLALLLALCDTLPRSAVRSAATVLNDMLTGPVLQEPARAWLGSALQSAELRGLLGSSVTAEDCGRFYSLATRVPPLAPMRGVGLIADFANMARGEETSDALLAYEL